mmetsp:Transcript_4205/g.12642  ORF Transcript_4205/g.12642 Transcript_4205/m.12642 type:complete len:94 (-) Transcript_4205:40-321(-)
MKPMLTSLSTDGAKGRSGVMQLNRSCPWTIPSDELEAQESAQTCAEVTLQTYFQYVFPLTPPTSSCDISDMVQPENCRLTFSNAQSLTYDPGI